jgi:hypothetical protein
VFATSNLVQIVGFIAWPITTLVLLFILVKSKAGSRLLENFGSRVSKVKGPGFELSLEQGSGERVKLDLETQFAEYRLEVRKRFDALNHQYDVIRLRDCLVEKVLLPACKHDASDLRCTIYVPDIVFIDALYRLTDYYPAGGESGKVYSIRFGIIGRQWRLRESRYEPVVRRDKKTLMKDWGMTLAQANAKSRDQAFLVVMLKADDVEQGLLLLTSRQKRPFGRTQDIVERVAQSGHTDALARHVARVNDEMRRRGPSLKLFDE